MGVETKIEWCDHTFSPWVGCTKVSPACDHCYAEGWAKRSGLVEWGNHPRRRTSAAYWRQPLKWDREAQAAGERRRVFCAALADVFDNQAPIEWFADLLDLIRRTPNLDWLLLTKRPQNILKRLREALAVAGARPDLAAWITAWLDGDPPANVWIGTTAENQEEADRRIPVLLTAPARVRFISAEPLLGPVDLRMLHYDGITNIDALTGLHGVGRPHAPGPRLNWVIAGGESGGGARPMQPDWARSLRDQCADAEVPFLFKQWGEFAPYDRGRVDSRTLATPGSLDKPVRRFGKKLAGRLLDGVEHSGFPA